jgi:hypothetical protein
MIRKNLVHNPSFRAGTEGWVATGGTSSISFSKDYAWYGVGSLKVTKNGTPNCGVRTSDSYLIPVTAGLKYTASAHILLPLIVDSSVTINLYVAIEWLDTYDTLISSSVSPTNPTLSGDPWDTIAVVGVAPTSAVSARISVTQYQADSASGQYFYLDAILFEQSSYVGQYVDNLTQAEENAVVNKALTPVQPPPITGMQLNADVALGDLILNTVDENNVVWVCTDIEGWWGHPDSEVPDIPRGVEDGSYEVTGRYGARQLTLHGVIFPPNPESLAVARDKIVAVTNLVRKGAWLRTSEEPTKASYVRLSGRPQFQTTGTRGRTEFSIGLRAADPIKYEWNDSDVDGHTIFSISASTGTITVNNKGDADVRVRFDITGPAGTNSYIYNQTTDQKITLAQPLRGTTPLAYIVSKTISSSTDKTGVVTQTATLTTSTPHQLVVGDNITLSGVGSGLDTVAGQSHVVTKVSNIEPYSFSFHTTGLIDFTSTTATTVNNGTLALFSSDTLSIDTYNKNISFNGDSFDSRYRVDAVIDWIHLAPGDNVIKFVDIIDTMDVVKKNYNYTTKVATIETATPHFYKTGDSIAISVPNSQTLLNKSITNHVATLTTTNEHGFSAGDIVSVTTNETASIVSKSASGTTATIAVDVSGSFQSGDVATINLAETAIASTKARSGSTVTITTGVDHKFSTGDAVTVDLATSAVPARKEITSATSTITTSSPHYFSTNDSVTLALPTTTTVNNKYIYGASATLTTTSDHNFSVGDKITVALPASATVVSTTTGVFTGSGGSPAYTVTLNTTSAHSFTVGDSISLTGLGSSDAKYTGTVVIQSIPTTTSFTYLYYGSNTATTGTTFGSGKTVTNLTNTSLNGTVTVTFIPSATQLTYTKGA